MAEDYVANRNNKKGPSDREHQNAKNTARTAAKAAGAYYGGALGEQAVDKLSRTKLGDKALNAGANFINNNRPLRNLSNRLNDSGIAQKAEGAIDALGGVSNRGGSTPSNTEGAANNAVNKENNVENVGGESSNSLPSSSSKEKENDKEDNKEDKSDDSSTAEEEDSFDLFGKMGGFLGKLMAIKAAFFSLLIIGPVVLIAVFVIILASSVTSFLNTEFDDGLGVSYATGGVTGNTTYKASSQSQENFYQRIQNVKLDMQTQGKTVDSLNVVAAYHALNNHGANIDYNEMSDSAIREFASAMFDGNTYSETTYKSNLVNNIIPKYLPNTTASQRKEIANEVFEYVDNYYDYVGEQPKNNSVTSSNTCNTGYCTYDIKGFYFKGKGNVAESLSLNNVYVRLMQCGSAGGHNYGGVFGQPLQGEDLVPFEKYVLGVAYAEIDPNVPKEAFKAQLVVARSYALARHLDGNTWKNIKKEGDKWVIQLANCTLDQVYCDPDQGCSSNSGQWGQVHSGLAYNQGYFKNPLKSNSNLRSYAAQTAGEVLITKDGYIIHSGYSEEQQTFVSLANMGLSYKQILIQVYNQGKRNYGATDIKKYSCQDVSECSSGEYTNWKQYIGSWISTKLGNSGKTIKQIGCLATSIAIQIARSGVLTIINDFNPGTFVEAMSQNGGFSSEGNLNYLTVSSISPSFKFQNKISLKGLAREQKLNKIRELTSQEGVYVVAEVKGNTGQHWVAIDSVNGDTITMMDPGSSATDMWSQYNWVNTSALVYYKVS